VSKPADMFAATPASGLFSDLTLQETPVGAGVGATTRKPKKGESSMNTCIIGGGIIRNAKLSLWRYVKS